MHMYKKCDLLSIIFKTIFRLLQLLNNFYHCFKAAAKTNTIFHYGKKFAGRIVDHKYFSNFLGTVPTFGFRISIVANVRSQNFYEELIVGSTKNIIESHYFQNDPRTYISRKTCYINSVYIHRAQVNKWLNKYLQEIYRSTSSDENHIVYAMYIGYQ